MSNPLRPFQHLAHIKHRFDHIDLWTSAIRAGHVLEFGVAFSAYSVHESVCTQPQRAVHALDSSVSESEQPSVAVACDKPTQIEEWLEHNCGGVSLIHMGYTGEDSRLAIMTVLFKLNSRISRGTILLFDEFCSSWADAGKRVNRVSGAARALQEWQHAFDRHIEPLSRGHTSAAAVMVKE